MEQLRLVQPEPALTQALSPMAAWTIQLRRASYFRYIQPSCFRLIPSFQILVMWRIRSPSNSIT